MKGTLKTLPEMQIFYLLTIVNQLKCMRIEPIATVQLTPIYRSGSVCTLFAAGNSSDSKPISKFIKASTLA